MINGVLVERTVKDVVPALKTNSDGLKQVLDELLKQYKNKQDEMDSWKVSCCSLVGDLETMVDVRIALLIWEVEMCRKRTIFKLFNNNEIMGERVSWSREILCSSMPTILADFLMGL